MIGVIGAMELEVSELASLIENIKQVNIGGREFNVGSIYGVQCVLAQCGVGKVNAAACAAYMISNFNPELIINTGIAGGIGMNLGDIVIASGFVQHDFDVTEFGYKQGLVPGNKDVFILADEKLSNALFESALSVRSPGGVTRGIIATGDKFVADSAVIKFIGENFGAVAVEMEGAAIAQVCDYAGVRFGAVRSISDRADEAAKVDSNTFAQIAADNSVGLVKEFLRKYTK